MKAAQATKPGAPLELVERAVPEPGRGQVLLRVEACGLCHSDSFTVEGHWPGIEYPRVPGHEVAGVIEKAGEGVGPWRVGQRVGVGWHGAHCTYCNPCRRGDFVACTTLETPGLQFDGGYAEYMVVSAQGLAALPENLSFAEAGPILCAGVTTFNALRHSGAVAGDVVAIQGIGGLGHLGVQYASRMGFETVAIGRGAEKEELARKLGAHHYIESGAQDVGAELKKLGGARTILGTAPDAKSMGPLLAGLGLDGTVVVVGAGPGSFEVSPLGIIGGRQGVRGWPSGISTDSEDALRMASFSGVRPVIETYPLEQAQAAYDRMMSGKARFRVVLKIR